MRKLVTGPRLVLALAFLAVIGWAALRGLPDGRLHVWFLDVGQGDAILIQAPDGQQILVDGGPSPSALLDQLGEVLPFWDRSLDLVVLTHPDADHVSGLIPLFDRYRVATAVDAAKPGEKAAEPWLAATSAAHVSRQKAGRGLRLAAGAVVLTALNPTAGSVQVDHGNNGSVVLRLDYGKTSLLLMGDAEGDAEQDMLSAGLVLRADVLKVGHHGSEASTSAQFLAAIQPQLAVISVGADNRFGHPAPELLRRLEGIEVLRTDERGRIELRSDGQRWTFRCEK
ncbi:MAG: ComEC/Rec2 family competence protein [Nitrososphaerales archaeon]